jgi:hypothetical protein
MDASSSQDMSKSKGLRGVSAIKDACSWKHTDKFLGKKYYNSY